jgi:ABC-type metal ion transport system substrate-binding protein
MTQQVKLAEALLRRKELNEKVAVLKFIQDRDLFEVKATRKPITESIDDVIAQVPKLTASQVTAEFDFYARQLRLVDAAIQQANWITSIAIPDTVMSDYSNIAKPK